jgi:pyrimidine operon attenuation protein / uracil phosphoribosyltransferase
MADAKKYILDQQVAEKKLRRMALGIIENNQEEKRLILAGIRESGTVVARTIQQMIAEFSQVQTELISVSIDKKAPGTVSLSKTMDFNDQVIILIDDVANSGKTLLYALKPFLDYHPKKIQTLVLIERSHNSFPVRPDYVGVSISTTLQEHIYVEVDGERVLGAYLV